jgi:hypothetical protein
MMVVVMLVVLVSVSTPFLLIFVIFFIFSCV